MKKLPLFLACLIGAPIFSMAQQVLPVPVRKAAPASTEKVVMRIDDKIITGISEPTVSVYLPDESKNTGAAVILCPGGGCSFASNGFENYLTEIASHGYIVAAVGSFNEYSREEINAMGMTDSKPPFPITEPGSLRPAEGPKDGWARGVGEGGKYGKEFGGTMRRADLVKLRDAVVYIIGDPADVAYPNANANYELIDHVPVFLCNLPVGHGGTYPEKHGGAFGDVTVKWLEWQMKGKDEQAAFFLDDEFKAREYPDWTVQRKNLQ